MIDKNVIAAFAECENYSDAAAYISDIALSSMWGDDADLQASTSVATVLWSIHADGIRSIVAHSGMSARAFAVAYGIPTRTMEDWCGGRRNPPDYVLLLLAHDQKMI